MIKSVFCVFAMIATAISGCAWLFGRRPVAQALFDALNIKEPVHEMIFTLQRFQGDALLVAVAILILAVLAEEIKPAERESFRSGGDRDGSRWRR